MRERKITSVYATGQPPDHVIVVMCDDGTMWELASGTMWTKCPSVPQRPVEPIPDGPWLSAEDQARMNRKVRTGCDD